MMEPDIPELQKWLNSRENSIKQLRLLVKELNKYQKGADISKVAGGFTAVGGALVGLGVFALGLVLGGPAALPVAITAGAGISGFGVGAAGEVAKRRVTKKKLEEVQTVLDKDSKCSETIFSLIEKVEKVESDITELLEKHVKDRLKKEGLDIDEITLPDDSKKSSESSFHSNSLANSLCGKDQQSKKLLSHLSKFADKLVSGVKIAKMINFLKVKKFLSRGKSVISPAFENLPKLGGACKNILQLGKVVRYGSAVVTLAFLPVEVYNLVQDSRTLQRGDCHEASKKVEDHIQNLEMDMKNKKEYLFQKIQELNNFVMLMNSLLSDGCSEDLGLLIIQILKIAFLLKPILRAFDRLDIQTHPPFTERLNSTKLSAVLINCERTDESFYKRLSTFIWCAWMMGNNTAVFLQNTALQDDPVLWTLFGVSVNSFDPIRGQGVSILLSSNFSGDILSKAEYQANNDWNGRCLVVNVEFQEETFSLVSVVAPDEKVSRDLFMREIAVFVKRNTRGKIIMGANFTCELQTMTLIVGNIVSRKVPFSLIKGLIPYKEVCEYLTDEHNLTEDPLAHTCRVLKKYTMMNADDIDIHWKFCSDVQLTTDNHGDQIKPLVDLGLNSLWENRRKAGTARLEFSTENEVSHRVVTCNQNLDFFISSYGDKKLERCYLDHTLRFLEFLTQSALVVEDI